MKAPFGLDKESGGESARDNEVYNGLFSRWNRVSHLANGFEKTTIEDYFLELKNYLALPNDRKKQRKYQDLIKRRISEIRDQLVFLDIKQVEKPDPTTYVTRDPVLAAIPTVPSAPVVPDPVPTPATALKKGQVNTPAPYVELESNEEIIVRKENQGSVLLGDLKEKYENLKVVATSSERTEVEDLISTAELAVLEIQLMEDKKEERKAFNNLEKGLLHDIAVKLFKLSLRLKSTGGINSNPDDYRSKTPAIQNPNSVIDQELQEPSSNLPIEIKASTSSDSVSAEPVFVEEPASINQVVLPKDILVSEINLKVPAAIDDHDFNFDRYENTKKVLEDFKSEIGIAKDKLTEARKVLKGLASPRFNLIDKQISDLESCKGELFDEADVSVLRNKIEKRLNYLLNKAIPQLFIIEIYVKEREMKDKARILSIEDGFVRVETRNYSGTEVTRLSLDEVNDSNWPVISEDKLKSKGVPLVQTVPTVNVPLQNNLSFEGSNPNVSRQSDPVVEPQMAVPDEVIVAQTPDFVADPIEGDDGSPIEQIQNDDHTFVDDITGQPTTSPVLSTPLFDPGNPYYSPGNFSDSNNIAGQLISVPNQPGTPKYDHSSLLAIINQMQYSTAKDRKKIRDKAEIAHKKYLKEYEKYENKISLSRVKRFGRVFSKMFGKETMPDVFLVLREESDRLSALAASLSDQALARRSERELNRVSESETKGVTAEENKKREEENKKRVKDKQVPTIPTVSEWQEKFAYNNDSQTTIERFREKFFERRLREELEARTRALPPERQSAVANIMKQMARHTWLMRTLVVGGATLTGGMLGAGAASLKIAASLVSAGATRKVGEAMSNYADRQLENERKSFKLGDNTRTSMYKLRKQLTKNEGQQLRANAVKVAGTIVAGVTAGNYADGISDQIANPVISVLDKAGEYVPEPVSDLFNGDNENQLVTPPTSVDVVTEDSPTEEIGDFELNQPEELTITDNEPATAEIEAEVEEKPETELKNYEVEAGDTLDKLSLKHFEDTTLKGLDEQEMKTVIANAMNSIDNTERLQEELGLRSGETDLIYAGEKMNLEALGEVLEDQRAEYEAKMGLDLGSVTPDQDPATPETEVEDIAEVTPDNQGDYYNRENLIQTPLGNLLNPELLNVTLTDADLRGNIYSVGTENFVNQFVSFVDTAGGEITGDADLNHEISTTAFKELQNFTVAEADYQLDRLRSEVSVGGGALTDYLSSEGVSPTSYLNLLEKAQYLLNEGGYLDDNSRPFPDSANENVGGVILKEFASLLSRGGEIPYIETIEQYPV